MSKKIGLISKKISQKEFTEVKNVFASLTGSMHVYDSKEVNEFLEEITDDVEKLETAAKTWYNDLQERLKEPKQVEQKQEAAVEVKEEPTQEEVELQRNLQEVSAKAAEKVKDVPEGIGKVQSHMVAFLEQAEAQSQTIVTEAMVEKRAILREAESQAREIMETAMDQAAQVKRNMQEEIEAAREAKRTMEAQAAEVQKEIMRKAERVERFGNEFNEFSASLRNIAVENRKQA